MAYISVDIEVCRRLNHHFDAVWSDKNPMKVSLSCITCSLETGMSAFAAYGVDTQGFGTMRRMRKPDIQNETISDS